MQIYFVIPLVSIAIIYLIIWLLTHKPRAMFASEMKYSTNNPDNSGRTATHPMSPNEKQSQTSVLLSVVIPCYNETARLKKMLYETVQYLNSNKSFKDSYEILIIDDGSKDNTADFALKLADELRLEPKVLKVFLLEENRGKGGAVTHGMKFAQGSYIIFADADGASQFSDINKLFESIQKLDDMNPSERAAMAIGSRAHMVDTDAVVKRSFIRNFLMYGLHALVYVFGIRDIKDTQCGFKLFNRKAVEMIFSNMHTEGWIFDVEVLILAANQGIPIAEVPINWHEVEGSKMDLARDSITMAIDLMVTRLAYLLGIYRVSLSMKKSA